MSLELEMPKNTAHKPQRRIKKFFFLLIFCVLIIALIWLFWTRSVSQNGELRAVLIPIASPLSSTVIGMATQEGAFVKKGQVLAYLDSTEYMQQRKEAEALVRGIKMFSAQGLAQDVENIQKAAEDMVQRLALARSEEHAKKILLEKQSLEHAKALLQKRSAANQNSSQNMAEAEKNEAQALLQLQQAKAAFELASLSRVAVEKNIQQYRDKAKFSPTNNYSAQSLENININPSHIIAPIDGYIVGNVPKEGDLTQQGEKIFDIMPEPQQGFHAMAIVERSQSKNLALSMPCFVVPKGSFSLWQGSIVGISQEASGTHIHIRLEKTWLSNDLTMAKQPAKVVFWPQKGAGSILPLLGILSFI